MKELIINLFGTYSPTTTTAIASDGSIYTVVAGGVAGVDFVWLAGVCAVLLTMYCLFRIVGGALRD